MTAPQTHPSEQLETLAQSHAKSNSLQRLQDMLAEAERKHLESAVDEDGRSALAGLHVQLVKAALQLKSDKASSLHLVREGNGRLHNSDRDMRTKTGSESHNRHLPRGNDEYDFRGGEHDPVDLSTLPEPESMRYVVEDIIPEGYPTNLYADSGQGKSYLALHLGCSIITGQPFLNRHVIQGQVLFLDWELDQPLQRLRWGEVTRGQGHNDPPAGLHYKRMAEPLLESLDEIYYWLDTIQPVLTIVDSVGMALGDDPLDHRRIIRFYSELRNLGTVLCIDHQPKPGGESTYAAKWEFGSSYKRHLARSSWQLERIGGDGTKVALLLRHKKSNFGMLCPDLHAVLTFEGDRRKTVKLGVVEAPDRASEAQFGLRAKVIAELKRQPLTAEALSKAIPEFDLGSIKNELGALKRDGIVVVVSKSGRARVYDLREKVESHIRHTPLGDDEYDESGAVPQVQQCSICGAERWCHDESGRWYCERHAGMPL